MARLPLPDPTVVLTCDKCGAIGPANEVFYLRSNGALAQSHCRTCEYKRVRDHKARRPKLGPPQPRTLKRRTTTIEVNGVLRRPCSTCKEVLTLDRFTFQKSRGVYNSICKSCRTKFEKARRDAGLRKVPNEVLRERSQRWRAANPEKARMGTRRRRARIAATGGTVTNQEWAGTLEAWGHRCAYCNVHAPGELTMDHVVPLSRGGMHIAENVVPACGPKHGNCNARKSARTGREFVGVA
jgi:5-methylcytosine-specific restriction endonuclease McrA